MTSRAERLRRAGEAMTLESEVMTFAPMTDGRVRVELCQPNKRTVTVYAVQAQEKTPDEVSAALGKIARAWKRFAAVCTSLDVDVKSIDVEIDQ